jgi:hypothetical protein
LQLRCVHPEVDAAHAVRPELAAMLAAVVFGRGAA